MLIDVHKNFKWEPKNTEMLGNEFTCAFNKTDLFEDETLDGRRADCATSNRGDLTH